MRIGYFADGPWAHRALEALNSLQGAEVAFIVPRYSSQDPVLAQMAEKLNIPFWPVENVNSNVFLQQVAEQDCELLISMSFDQIFKRPLIELAPKGLINCHAGALPFYRGRNILNWALINGAKEFGVTVHYVDEGIDTGDIIQQDMVPISPQDNYATVLEKAFIQCPDSLLKAVRAIHSGNPDRIVQSTIHPTGFYCGRRTIGDENIDWQWSSTRAHNFIRGICSPGPNARTFFNGAEFAIVASELIAQAPEYIGTCGEVIGRDELGILVKTGDTFIRLSQVAKVLEGQVQTPQVPKFKIGTRLK